MSLENESSGVYADSHDGVLPVLQAVNVDIFIQQDAAQVLLRQTFWSGVAVKNAVYRFPTDAKAFVCGFEAEIGGKRVVGVVTEKEEAKKKFAAAQRAGQGAYLAETVDKDRVDMTLGNIEADTLFSVSITFIIQCQFSSDGLITFTLPSPLLGNSLPNVVQPPRLDIVARIQATSPIFDVHCAHHCLEQVESKDDEVSKSAFCAVFTTTNRSNRKRPREGIVDPIGECAPCDFVLQYRVTNPSEANVLIERANLKSKFSTTYAVALSFFPSPQIFPSSESLVIYFVVDRSGSMEGSRMQSASQTLICALRNLPERCMFQIIGFGLTHCRLFPTPVVATAENIRKAKDHSRNLKADLGGTELSGPLADVYGSLKEGATNAIFLITDGEVSNTTQVSTMKDHIFIHPLVQAASEHPNVRIFTFGVGEGVDASLLCDLSRASGGKPFFVADNEGPKLKEIVLSAFLALSQPALTQLSMDWGELSHCRFISNIAQTPCTLRPVFPGESFKVFAIITTCLPECQVSLLPTAIAKLSGLDVSGQQVEFAVTLDLSCSTQGTLLHRLCAYHAITELIDRENPAFGSEAAVRAECLSLALTYSLSCKYTSFLAIEKRITPRQKNIEDSMSGLDSQTSLASNAHWQTSRAAGRVPLELVELVSEYDDADFAELKDLLQKPLPEEEAGEQEGLSVKGLSPPSVAGPAAGMEEELEDYDEDEGGVVTFYSAPVRKGSYCGIHSSGFREFLLKPELLHGLTDCAFEYPSEVQMEVLPQAQIGIDVICQAKSGMGKTLVFLLALLHQLPSPVGREGVYAVVLCPGRELAYQTCGEFVRFSKYLPEVITRAYFDGVESPAATQPPHIVVGTPGYVLQLAVQGVLDFSSVKYFVVDECDNVFGNLDMLRDVQSIFKLTPHDKQVMLFSTTLSPEMRVVCREFTQNPVEIYREGNQLALYGLQQYFVKVDTSEKADRLADLLKQLAFKQVIIFVHDEKTCEELNACLVRAGVPSERMREGSILDQLARFDKLRAGAISVLVCTDAMARGIDFAHANGVVNFDMPLTVEEYLHRVGRCGRFGTKGLIISFLSSSLDDSLLKQAEERYEVEVSALPDVIERSSYAWI